MKVINKYLIKLAIVCSFFILIGCDDFLSEIPDNRTTIDSQDKIAQLITGAYSEGNYQMMASIMSDNAEQKVENVGDRMQRTFYNWEDATTFETDRDSPTFFWNSTYEAIAQANQALLSISELENEIDLQAEKGEALLARAYGHFMIANFWCKRYDSATANSDLGIPYILTPETSLLQNYERGTLLNVYELIEKDLIEGFSLVQNSYDNPDFHFTKAAAAAFAARFYLYKGEEWDNVIKYASIAVTNPQSQLRNMVSYRPLTYDQNRLLYPSVDEPSNLLIVSTSSLWQRSFASTNFGMSIRKANDLFFAAAGNPFDKNWAYAVYGTDVVYNFPKYAEYFRITNQSAGIGQPFTGIILFDRDEAILNRAEAYVMNEDYVNALIDLNIFISKKTLNYDASTDILTEDLIISQYPPVVNEFTPYYSINEKQTSFVKFISEMKRRESYHEGLRWFDIKRFDLEVSHSVSRSGTPNILPKGDNRRLLNIPKNALKFGLVDNPR